VQQQQENNVLVTISTIRLHHHQQCAIHPPPLPITATAVRFDINITAPHTLPRSQRQCLNNSKPPTSAEGAQHLSPHSSLKVGPHPLWRQKSDLWVNPKGQ
jgi:hypothetical protein